MNDTLIHQYRESRSVWTHGAGKYFRIYRDGSGLECGVYAGLHGMLSFPSWNGISDRPPVKYNLVPSAGAYFCGHMAGLKTGVERYSFGSIHEAPWKLNITLYVLIPVKRTEYVQKEIIY